MSKVKKDRFGRYLILDHLVDGGMAKICRARFLGEQADRIVAIKMVQPKFSEDLNFKTMFMDEIKVTFGLLHPNIVQTYDYGFHKGQLYVAMEYCDGKNLKEFLNKLTSMKYVFPVEVSVYIITQACQGLHYAHTYVDKLSGKEANIIHRDISPHNIMMTYDGAVKVIDFGIAKATTNSEATEAGTIKGKLAYLAPEYIEGDEIDHRYDQFAIGITLWEMLCSRRLFKAENDIAVLRKITDCKIPRPSSINPNVPKALDDIIMKALSRDPEDRFENMDKLNRALIKFLYANYPEFNASDLQFFASELFKDEIKKDREKLFEYGKIDIAPFLKEYRAELEHGTATPDDEDNVEKTLKRQEMKIIDFDESENTEVTAATMPQELPPDRTEVTEVGEETSATVPGQTLSIDEIKPVKVIRPEIPIERKPRLQKVQKTKEATKTDVQTETMEYVKPNPFLKLAAWCALVVLGGFLTILFLPDPPVKGAGTTPKPKPTVVPVEYAEVTLNNFDQFNQSVYLNGDKIKPDVLQTFKVEAGKQHIVRVETSGKKPFVKKIKVTPDSKETILVSETALETYAQLKSNFNCPRGKLYINLYGEERVVKLPFDGHLYQIPAKGDGRQPASDDGVEYEVYFEPATGPRIQRRISFKVKQENESIEICPLVTR